MRPSLIRADASIVSFSNFVDCSTIVCVYDVHVLMLINFDYGKVSSASEALNTSDHLTSPRHNILVRAPFAFNSSSPDAMMRK